MIYHYITRVFNKLLLVLNILLVVASACLQRGFRGHPEMPLNLPLKILLSCIILSFHLTNQVAKLISEI